MSRINLDNIRRINDPSKQTNGIIDKPFRYFSDYIYPIFKVTNEEMEGFCAVIQEVLKDMLVNS